MTTQTSRKKRMTVVALAALAVAGITAGGALVTSQSTILDNVFGTTATQPVDPPEMVVTGPSMTKSFSGVIDGEVVSEYYVIENKSSTKDLQFNVGTQLHPGGANHDELAAALDTRIGYAGRNINTGKLNSMNIGTGDLITVPQGDSVTIRVDVFVKDSAAFTVDPDSEVTVDFLFDSIFS